MNSNTVCIYDGPSQLTGHQRVIALVTGYAHKSANTKTGGEMLQGFILSAAAPPRVAAQTGADAAVCGSCKLRPVLQKIMSRDPDKKLPCYVDLVRGAGMAWRSWKAGNIWNISPAAAGAKAPYPLRAGAYGDVAAVPLHIWDAFENASPYKTGTSYTHAWAAAPEHAAYSMASIDPVNHPDIRASLDKAHALGFRTYRVDSKRNPIGLLEGEIYCPEQTRGITCSSCLLCAGNRISAKNIVIDQI